MQPEAPYSSLNLFGRGIPHCGSSVEIRIVGHMGTQRGIVTEFFVFDHSLARTYGLKKIGFVVDHIVVSRWYGENLGLFIQFGLQRS